MSEGRNSFRFSIRGMVYHDTSSRSVSIMIGALVCGINRFTRGLSRQSLDRTFQELRVAVCALVCFGIHSDGGRIEWSVLGFLGGGF